MTPTWQRSVDEEEAQRAERKACPRDRLGRREGAGVDRNSRRKRSPCPYPAIGDFMSPELRRFWRI
jgi:hypothetical protein